MFEDNPLVFLKVGIQFANVGQPGQKQNIWQKKAYPEPTGGGSSSPCKLKSGLEDRTRKKRPLEGPFEVEFIANIPFSRVSFHIEGPFEREWTFLSNRVSFHLVEKSVVVCLKIYITYKQKLYKIFTKFFLVIEYKYLKKVYLKKKNIVQRWKLKVTSFDQKCKKMTKVVVFCLSRICRRQNYCISKLWQQEITKKIWK